MKRRCAFCRTPLAANNVSGVCAKHQGRICPLCRKLNGRPMAGHCLGCHDALTMRRKQNKHAPRNREPRPEYDRRKAILVSAYRELAAAGLPLFKEARR